MANPTVHYACTTTLQKWVSALLLCTYVHIPLLTTLTDSMDLIGSMGNEHEHTRRYAECKGEVCTTMGLYGVCLFTI